MTLLHQLIHSRQKWCGNIWLICVFLLLEGRECWEMRKKDKTSLERTGWANFTALNEQGFVNQPTNEH